jgi:tellurium resistance protein TerD
VADTSRTTLTRGRNLVLSDLARVEDGVRVAVGWEPTTPGSGLDVQAAALLVGAEGTVLSDAHLVFYNQRTSPDGTVVLVDEPIDEAPGADRQVLTLDLAHLEEGVERVLIVVSVYDAEERDQTLADATGVFARVLSAEGTEVVRYDLDVETSIQTAVSLLEVYRAGDDWKVMAVGQSWASGLRGVATDFGVHV